MEVSAAEWENEGWSDTGELACSPCARLGGEWETRYAGASCELVGVDEGDAARAIRCEFYNDCY